MFDISTGAPVISHHPLFAASGSNFTRAITKPISNAYCTDDSMIHTQFVIFERICLSFRLSRAKRLAQG